MRIIIEPTYDMVSKWVAAYIAKRINDFKPSTKKPFILGLPTGSSPIGTYKELVRLNKEGKVSFKNVATFNMDEYIGIPQAHPESYHSFMMNHLFNHIDINPKNVHILNGNAKDLDAQCREYEEQIQAAGGIELFLGGIGPDGHIAFNEPGSSLRSRTRIKTLMTDTIIANSRFFDNDISKVPKTALTVGVGTVLDAREVVIIISGHSKARALHHVIEEGVNHIWTVSALQLHPHAMIVCDDAACDEIKVGTYRYFKDIEKDHLAPAEL
ncbi:MAG: glucosamine-6-phosphate deaminase [Candidatus Sumerlaeota bacterium]|nr:glucosamine-6-phosphate deaminase [Candidatus Sumerlaeota bacterium]